jgi:serine phosphatase RsbU (regulator of sigma subunit)
MVFQEEAFQKVDFLFLAQFFVFFFLQNFFLYFRFDKEPLSALLVGAGALIPLVLTFIWAGLQAKDPYHWPVSNYAAFHFAIVLIVILLNVFSVTSYLTYLWRRNEAARKTLRQEVIDLREIQEGYYFYENFFRIEQILSNPTIDTEEAMRQVMKVLTDMGEYGLLQKGAFFLTAPGGKSLRMLVQYNADNLLQTCLRVPEGKCLCGRVLVSKEPLYKSCVDHEHEQHPPGMKPHGHYVLPVRWEDEMLGVFTLYIADGAPYSERTMGFLRMVSDAIAKRIMLHRQKEKLEEQLREIRAGHRAAAGLMQAIIPAPELLHNRFPGVQALWYQPSQEVGGDFYFFYEKGRSVYFGVGDAEGHGVVGAILAGVLSSEIQNLLYIQNEIRPAELTKTLHQMLLRIYGDAEAIFRSGADLAVCQYDREQRVLRYAGARLPLLYSTNGKIEIIEPVPAAIGTERMEESEILDTELTVQPGLRLYLMSDGLASQLSGGSTQTPAKFGRRRLYEILEQTTHLPLPEQLQKVQAAIRQWQSTTSQTDDIILWILEPAGE